MLFRPLFAKDTCPAPLMWSVVPGKEKGREKEVSTRQSKGGKQQFGVGGKGRSASLAAQIFPKQTC